MWKIQHPNGRWEMNEIHVPAGKPVKLTMISEDVIHDFGMPAFRVNMDVVPGKYTQTWFNPTRVGRYHIFCAQYCGTNHAIMGGYVTVMEPDDFEKWMQTGNVQASAGFAGRNSVPRERLHRLSRAQCQCARAFAGWNLWKRPPGSSARRPSVDRRICPRKRSKPIIAICTIRFGFRPRKSRRATNRLCRLLQGSLTEEETIQLIDYIKTLGTSNGTSNGAADWL